MLQTGELIVTFSCRRIACVLVCGLPRNIRDETYVGQTTVARDALARSLAREVQIIDGDNLLVELDDPIEVVAAARDHHKAVFLRVLISRGALQLLREPTAPAQELWQWLCKHLEIDADAAYLDGLVTLDCRDAPRLPPFPVEDVPDRPGVLLWILEQGYGRVLFIDKPTLIGRAQPHALVGIVERGVTNDCWEIKPYKTGWGIFDTGATFHMVLDQEACEPEWAKQLQLMPGRMIELPYYHWVALVVLAVRT